MRHPWRGKKPGLWQIWRGIFRHKYYEGGPLRDQLFQYQSENDVTREALYLELLTIAPHAKSGTKKKWKKALGLAT